MKKKIIIELDRILIGNIEYLLDYKKLIDIIIDNCKHKKIDEKFCNIKKDLWKKNISPNFFRPYLKDFFNKYKSKYDFYIFTNIEKNIALELIELIEEFANITFKKPIFTYEDIIINSSNEYKKDITFFSPLSSFIIIDYNNYWPSKDINIISPKIYDYKFIPIIDSDLLNLIRNIELKGKFKLLPNIFTNNYDEFYFNYHLYTSQIYRQVEYENREYIKDDFFNKILIKYK